MLEKPVLDETGLTNRYDYELKWEANEQKHPDAETLTKAVLDQLGLELRPAKRKIEVVVVDNASVM